jgi:hypothetical protein
MQFSNQLPTLTVLKIIVPLLLDMKEYLSYSDSAKDGKDFLSFFVNAVNYVD